MQPGSRSPVKTTTMPRTDGMAQVMAQVHAYVRRSALGDDGLWIFADRSLADRILADRSLADRRRRWRRLLTWQIGGGRGAQHPQARGSCDYDLQHRCPPCFAETKT